MGTERKPAKPSMGLRSTATNSDRHRVEKRNSTEDGKNTRAKRKYKIKTKTSRTSKQAETMVDNIAGKQEVIVEFNGEILDSKDALLDFLKMGAKQFDALHKKYPFLQTLGITGKINRKFYISSHQARRWVEYVQRQESRHPEMRRFRPEEPPDLTEIKGR